MNEEGTEEGTVPFFSKQKKGTVPRKTAAR
jgi:hypothetical protein